MSHFGGNKRGRISGSPSIILAKIYSNKTGAFLGGDASPVSSKTQNSGPLAAAIAKVRASMDGRDCSDPAWATVHLLLGAFEEQEMLVQELRQTVGGVFVRASLTKEQRKEDYLLRKELRKRRALGGKWRIEGWPGQERKIVPVQEN